MGGRSSRAAAFRRKSAISVAVEFEVLRMNLANLKVSPENLWKFMLLQKKLRNLNLEFLFLSPQCHKMASQVGYKCVNYLI